MLTRVVLSYLFLLAIILFGCSDETIDNLNFQIEVRVYESTTKDFDLTNSTITVTSETETLVEKDLDPTPSKIEVLNQEGRYLIKITKPDYLPFEKYFTASELKEYETTPLVVNLLLKSVTEGLVAYYPFNSNANDSTTNHFNGIVHNAVMSNDRKGNSNSSYYFDGVDDYISVPHNAALNLDGNFSISLWAKVSSSQLPHEGINDILRKWNGDAAGYPFSISYLNTLASDDKEDKLIYVRYDGQGCANAPTSYSPIIDNDVFIHIVFIKEGSTLLQFLNNVLIQQYTDDTSCGVANTADMTIGCRGNLVRFFKGNIDDIRIYGRSISNEEVGNLYFE